MERDIRAEVRRAAKAEQAADRAHKRTVTRRDALIKEAKAYGILPAMIMADSGLSRPRLYQILGKQGAEVLTVDNGGTADRSAD